MVRNTASIIATLLAGALFVSSPHVQAGGKGTYFALEVDGGAAFGLSYDESKPGYSAGISLGIGGRPGGMPFRLYLLAKYDRNNMVLEGSYLTLDRTTNSLLFGPRLIVPMFAGLRFFTEAMIGPAWISSKLDAGGSGSGIQQDTETRFAYSLGAGFQYRIMKNLSFGVEADFQDEDKDDQDPLVLLVTGSSGDPGRRVSLSAFATLHF